MKDYSDEELIKELRKRHLNDSDFMFKIVNDLKNTYYPLNELISKLMVMVENENHLDINLNCSYHLKRKIRDKVNPNEYYD